MSIENNYATIRSKIAKACGLSHRQPSDVQLVAVTKTIEMERILPLLALNHRHFGENYVQEAADKWANHKSEDVKLHLIGALQSNKASVAVALFDVIETLDRLSLATALKKACDQQSKTLEFYVQINVGEEPQKGGVAPRDADEFIAKMRDEFQFNVTGLMCIPPDNQAPAPYFAFLNTIAKRHGLKNLSMGMSADYEQAIELGATHVRVGSALFGARPQKA